MKHMSVADTGELAELIHQVARGQERIAMDQDGEPVAFLISAADFSLLAGLEEEEERLDLEAIQEAVKETGSIPWKEIKENQGLQVVAYQVFLRQDQCPPGRNLIKATMAPEAPISHLTISALVSAISLRTFSISKRTSATSRFVAKPS